MYSIYGMLSEDHEDSKYKRMQALQSVLAQYFEYNVELKIPQ